MKSRNVIENIKNNSLSKKELMALIDKAFTDLDGSSHGCVAVLTTTTMTDGTKMQSVTFGKLLKE